MKALNRLSKLGYKWDFVSGEVLPDPGKKVLLVELGGVNDGESRLETLRTRQVYCIRVTSKYREALAIYTGQESSCKAPESTFVHSRRDAEPISSSGMSCNTVLTSAGTSDEIMLYTSECPVLKINGTNLNLTSGTSVRYRSILQCKIML